MSAMETSVLYVTPEQYHADPCKVPSLSSSIARTIVDQSPEHALELHPRREELGWVARSAELPGEDEEEDPSKSLDQGNLIHALVLGKGREGVLVVEADNWRTKAAREARDEARAAGLVPVTRPVFDRADRVAGILRGKIAALGYSLEQAAQRAEVAIAWVDEGVQCRGMLDYVDLDQGLVLDLKTSRSAHPEACRRHVTSYGYDIQHAAYTRAATALRPELAGRVELVFLFAELTPPYSVTPARLSGAMRELGEMRWARARRIWAECVRTRVWPGYAASGPVLLEPKPWDIEAEMIAGAEDGHVR